MRIGIIGAGAIGGTMCRLLDAVGHEVVVANSRGPESLTELVATTHRARAGSTSEAIAFGDPVVLAIPYGRYGDLPAAEMAGKILVDTTNYTPDRDGHLPELDPEAITETELIGRHLRGTRLVKAFNTMYYETLALGGHPGGPWDERLVLFVAGDDQPAKTLILGLVDELGFAGVDTGSLATGGRLQQPSSHLFNVALRPGDVQFEGHPAA